MTWLLVVGLETRLDCCVECLRGRFMCWPLSTTPVPGVFVVLTVHEALSLAPSPLVVGCCSTEQANKCEKLFVVPFLKAPDAFRLSICCVRLFPPIGLESSIDSGTRLVQRIDRPEGSEDDGSGGSFMFLVRSAGRE